jgi:hypothetical protein
MAQRVAQATCAMLFSSRSGGALALLRHSICLKALLAQPDEIGALIAPAPYRPLSPE